MGSMPLNPIAGLAGVLGQVMARKDQERKASLAEQYKSLNEHAQRVLEAHKNFEYNQKLADINHKYKLDEEDIRAKNDRENQLLANQGQIDKQNLANEGQFKITQFEHSLQNPEVQARVDLNRAQIAEAKSQEALNKAKQHLYEYKTSLEQSGKPDQNLLQQIFQDLDVIDKQSESLLSTQPNILEASGLTHKMIVDRMNRVAKQKQMILQQMGMSQNNVANFGIEEFTGANPESDTGFLGVKSVVGGREKENQYRTFDNKSWRILPDGNLEDIE